MNVMKEQTFWQAQRHSGSHSPIDNRRELP